MLRINLNLTSDIATTKKAMCTNIKRFLVSNPIKFPFKRIESFINVSDKKN